MHLSVARKAEQWVHTLSRIASWLSMVVLLLMTFLITFDVGGRYGFKRPIAGSIDIIEVLMILLVFPGFAYCAAVDGHVRVDVLYVRIPQRVQALVDVVTSTLSVFIVSIMAWQLGARAMDILRTPPGPATGYFQWPLLPFIVLAAAGTGLLGLELLIWFVRSVYRAVYRAESSESMILAKQEMLATQE